jgi:hyperosmotically inducible periplasmic protein
MEMKCMTLILAALAVFGCKSGGTDSTSNDPVQAGPQVPADNTDKNERDRHADSPTPGDQAENEVDRSITQQARQGVVADDALSVGAKNVKIITADGVVTLRGPVKTAQEKADIARIVQKVDGVKRVENQLEVAAN